MARRPEIDNVGVRRGCWGEDRAVEYLRLKGYEILDRNACPVSRDRRLEIDIVAYEVATDTLVFVEVKQHRDFSPYQRRLRSVTAQKRRNVRRAFNAWRRINRWETGYRFDVIEVYGTPEGGRPVIDHVERVDLFVPNDKTVRWR